MRLLSLSWQGVWVSFGTNPQNHTSGHTNVSIYQNVDKKSINKCMPPELRDKVEYVDRMQLILL